MTEDHLLPRGRTNGLFVDTEIAKGIHGGTIKILLDVVRHDLGTEKYLLCDSDYAYGVIEFPKQAVRISRQKATVIVDSAGLRHDVFQHDWKTKRKLYRMDFVFDKFITPRRIQSVTADHLSIGHASIIMDVPAGIIDAADPRFADEFKDLSYPVKAYIISL